MSRRKYVKPSFEVLEDRWAPAVHLVTRIGDHDRFGFAGELRTEINGSVSGDTILVESSVILNQAEFGPISVPQNLTIIGTRGAVIDGNRGQAFDFSRGGGPVSESITGVTFENSISAGGSGGAIFVAGSLTLNACIFVNNSANAGSGGAVDVAAFGTSSFTVSVTGCTFTNNTAASGGALNIEPNGNNNQPVAASISVTSCIFQNDGALGGSGGAIQATGTLQTLNVTDSQFQFNRATGGGGAIYSRTGVFQVQSTPGNYSLFDRNRNCAVTWLPGIQNGGFRSGVITVTGIQFTTNAGGALDFGGNTGVVSATTIAISGCLFSGNTDGDGGALYVRGGGLNASVNIVNSTFFKNEGGRGGAIAIIAAAVGRPVTLVLTSVTITENTARIGGGIWMPAFAGTFQIRNSIVAGNKADQGYDVFGGVVSLGFNLIGVSEGSTGWNTNAGNPLPDQVGSLIAPKFPGLGNLDNNGGQTLTLAVPNTSLAYRTGDPSLQGAAFPYYLDQRARTRNGMVAGKAVVTVGAFEPDALGGNAPNHAPVGANNTVATLDTMYTTPNNVSVRITSYTFGLADFRFSDPNDSPANNFRGVWITSPPAAGDLVLNGSLIRTQAFQPVFVSAANIAAGGLVFYAWRGSGSPYATFTFQVQDDGGTANGGVDTDTTARTMTINVTRVNNAPVGTDNTVTTLKNTSYTFAAGDFGFTDPNDVSPNNLYAVKITTLPSAGTLADIGVAVTAGQFVSVNDINAGYLVFTPATSVTGRAYSNMTFQVQDNGGTANGGVDLDATPRTMTINVMDNTWVNHAPVGTNHSVTTLENTPYSVAAADFGFTDPNETTANNFLAVKITTLPTGGTLTDNGVTVAVNSFVSASHITAGLLVYTPNANTGGTGYDSFAFKVKDDGGTNNSGVNLDTTARTMTINVTKVNQAPIGTANTVTTLENTAKVFAAADFGFNDPNDSSPNSLAAVEITSLPMFGTLTDNGTAVSAGQFISVSDINAGHLVFTPEVNMSGAGYDSFFFQVQDNGGTTGGGIDTDPTPRIMTVDVTWVNQAPVGTSTTVNTPENTAYVVQAGDFGFTDPNDPFSNWFQAVKIVTLPSTGTLTDNGTAVSVNQFVSLDDILAGLLVYTPPTNAYGTSDSFTFKVQDDGGTANSGVDLDTSAKTLTVNVPVIAVSSVVVNGGAPAYTDANGLSFSLAGQNSVVEQILVTFNEAVTLDSGAFTITNLASSVTVVSGAAPSTDAVTASFAVVPGSGNTQYIVTFSGAGTIAIPGGTGNVIKDGVYQLNTIGAHVHANGFTAPADNHVIFWALYGSVVTADNTTSGGTSEVVVDNYDYSAFVAAYGSESDIPSGTPAYNVALDGDLNGFIDNFDYSEFGGNFGADWMFSIDPPA